MFLLQSSHFGLNWFPKKATGRPDPRQVITAPGWRKSPYIQAQLFFENVALSEDSEKEKFYSELANSLKLFPTSVSHHKVLPHLCAAAEISSKDALWVLPPLLVIGKSLEAAEFQRQVEPVVVKLFANPDRALRVTLLQHLEGFVKYLSPQLTADTIYPQVAQGFTDTHAVLRELSVKALLYLVPKMDEASGGISEAKSMDVAKQMGARMSSDQEPIIRTNTIVCLGKIAGSLTPKTREKAVIQVLLKGTKDPFKHARGAAVMALASIQEFYPVPAIASSMLPAICPLTADPDREVRAHAFGAVRSLLQHLEQQSEVAARLQLDAEAEERDKADHSNGLGGSEPQEEEAELADNSAGWGSWAMSSMSKGITSMVAGSKNADSPASSSQETSASTGATAPTSNAIAPATGPDDRKDASHSNATTASSQNVAPPSGTTVVDKSLIVEESTGWDSDDGWGDVLDEGNNSKPAPVVKPRSGKAQTAPSVGSLHAAKAVQTMPPPSHPPPSHPPPSHPRVAKVTSKTMSKPVRNDDQGRVISPDQAKVKPKKKEPVVATKSGWDDDGDGWGDDDQW